MQFPFFGKKENKHSLYLGLFLKETAGIAFVFEKTERGMDIVEKLDFSYSNSWENVLEDVDEALFKLENKLKSHLTECIFFVYSHFIDESTKEIKKNYLTKVKELVKNLELEPLGYIECIDAVTTYVETREEMPLTAVLAEFDSQNIGIFIYKGGREVAHKIVSRTDSITDDFLSAFSEIKSDMLLPSRIILYNSSDLGAEATKILTYRWSEDFFIQLPKVEILKEEEVHMGLAAVFSGQIAGGIVESSVHYEPEKEDDAEKDESGGEVMGFVIGRDINEMPQKPEEVQRTEFSQQQVSTPKKSKFDLAAIFSFFQKFRFPSIGFPSPKGLSQKTNIIVGISVIVLALFLEEFFLHTADLILIAPTQKIIKSEKILGKIDSPTGDIEINVASASGEFSQSKTTSGKKDVGTKAKGTVILYNFTTSDKQFAGGTTIVTDNIKFTLDSDVSASSAATVIEGGAPVRKPGSVKVRVTAADIGTAGNVDKGRQFTVGGASTESYLAIAESAFTGGSKKQIQTVAKKDLDDLKTAVLTAAKSKGTNFDSAANADSRVLEGLTELAITNTKFSKEVGEESDSVSLAATVTTTFYTYKKDSLLEFLLKNTKDKVKQGFILTPKDITYSIDKTKKTDGNFELQITETAISKKNISEKDVASKMIFSDKNKVDKILRDIYGLTGYNLNIDPKLPFLQDRMPLFKKNIRIKISTTD